jgi:translation initiation factor IF-3
VRLIGDEEEQLGIMGIQKAIEMAKEAGVDLVEVSPQAHPPVCRLMDFGKFIYRQKKQEQKHKAMQKKSEVKGIRISLRTDKHDIQVKVNKAREFLEYGHSIKVTLIFRGREVTHYALALDKMIEIKEALKDVAKVDAEPKKQGYNLFMILSPL